MFYFISINENNFYRFKYNTVENQILLITPDNLFLSLEKCSAGF